MLVGGGNLLHIALHCLLQLNCFFPFRRRARHMDDMAFQHGHLCNALCSHYTKDDGPWLVLTGSTRRSSMTIVCALLTTEHAHLPELGGRDVA
eukprot:3413751-Amphidinium_carterae.1